MNILEMPWRGYDEPSFEIQVPGSPHSHQVRVWLPSSYHHTTDGYPVLWVTDNLLEHAISALMSGHGTEAPEVIVVAVGPPSTITTAEFSARRNYDFLPGIEHLSYDPAMLEHLKAAVGGADAFRDYLIDELRPQIEAKYRTNGDHGIAGDSGGAMFSLYVLFTRPEAFAKYLIGSPAMGIDYDALEDKIHADRGDINARVFMMAGGAELTDPGMAGVQIVSTMARISERLTLRAYEGLTLNVSIYPGGTHTGTMPVLFSEGLRWLWA